MRINEIFKSIDGEGCRTGAPTIFVRFAGCNLRCEYCDTPYALEGSQGNPEYDTLSKVMDRLNAMLPDRLIDKSFINFTFTGGEPLLHQDDILMILEALHGYHPDLSFSINIETNGSIDPKDFIRKYTGTSFARAKDGVLPVNELFFTFDIKTASAGKKAMEACFKDDSTFRLKFIQDPLDYDTLTTSVYRKNVIKAVVGSIEELDWVKRVLTYHSIEANINLTELYDVYISPVYGKIDPREIVNYIINNSECNGWKAQVQLHKIIWDPDTTGV